MNILDLLEVAGDAGDLARRLSPSPVPTPDWATDEEAFLRHFGVEVAEYEEIVALLSPDQLHLLRDTLAINPEAAVLWVLAMEELA